MPKHIYDCVRYWPKMLPHRMADDLAVPLPPAVDLRPHCPTVYDQLSLGDCTGNALAGNVQFVRMKEKLPNNWVPSRLFIYYDERQIEGDIPQDAGASLTDGVKSLGFSGVCPETTWPYDITKFAVAPPKSAYQEALKHRANFAQINNGNLNQIKLSLATGWPLVIGFTVYESFESSEVAQTGIVPMPSLGEAILGGHAVEIVGYRDSVQRFIVRNSWGADWGEAGYFEMPYPYFTNLQLASDCWSCRKSG